MVEPLGSLLLATGNAGKLSELRALLVPLGIEVVAPVDRNLHLEVDETESTFRGNALLKARAYAKAARLPTLADDSGLEVDALEGAPGVHSARYAGEDATHAANNAKLLRALAGSPNRSARFRCVLVLVDADGRELRTTEGSCDGTILSEPHGRDGFGYDPLFVPEGEQRSMAELSAAEKNALSHRGHAVRAMRDWLLQRA